MRIARITGIDNKANNKSVKNTQTFTSRHTVVVKEGLNIINKQLEKIAQYNLIDCHLYWQMYTLDGVRNAKNLKEISDTAATISGIRHNLYVEKPFSYAVINMYNTNPKSLSHKQKAITKHLYKAVNESLKLTEEQVIKSKKLEDASYRAWEKAKPNSDYQSLLPHFKALLDNNIELAEIVKGKPVNYNDFLDGFAPGWTSEEVDPILNKLGDNLSPVVKKVSAKIAQNPSLNDLPFLKKHVSQETIDKFVQKIATDMGFDFKRGKISKTEHPFMMTVNGRYDIRFNTEKPKKNPTILDLLDTATSALHECGHALVGQNLPEKFHNTPLDDFPSDLHESQSRLWENIIGRSKEFWQGYLPYLKEIDPKTFKNVTAEDLYRGVNMAKANPIRIQADELSYNLHILMRYNLEKEFINNKNFDFNTLPEKWTQESQRLLGITPKNNAEGVMQDVHWNEGLIGYFPTYSLGSLAYPQFFNAIKKDVPDIEAKILKHDFKAIKEWLTNNVYKYGQEYSSKEVIEKATGESLNPKYFTDYITKKYSEIYGV